MSAAAQTRVPPGARPKGGLARAASRGLLWEGGAQVAYQLLHLAVRLLLARVLAPREFGLVAMAVLFVSFVELSLDLGIGQALVQRKELGEPYLSTAYWTVVALGVSAFGLLAALSPLVAAFFDAPRVAPLLVALALTLPIQAVGGVHSAMLQRGLRFRALGSRKIVSVLVGGTLGIAAAYGGAKAWALVVDALARQTAMTLFLWLVSPWRPRVLFSRTAFRELWRHGRWIAGGSVLNFFSRNLDNILVGRFAGPAALGLYAFAYQMIILPMQYLLRPLNNVLGPILVHARERPERCREAVRSIAAAVELTVWPLLVAAAVSSPWLVPALLGPKWAPAVPILRILTAAALVQVIAVLGAPVYYGFARPDLALRVIAVAFALNTTGIVIGLAWGAVGVAVGVAIAALALAPLCAVYLRRLLDWSWADQLGLFVRGALCATAGIAAGLTVGSALDGFRDWTRGIGAAVATGLVYLGVSRLVLRDAWQASRWLVEAGLLRRNEAAIAPADAARASG